MWSFKLGENFVFSLFYYLDMKPYEKKPKGINKMIPDLETENFILEIKTRNF